MSIGIFYGSTGGATESVAEEILNTLGLKAELHDIGLTEADKLNDYSHLIIGTSTWGAGELQDDWEDKLAAYEEIDFTGKTVAFFGLGDQEGYGENFVDGMGILHDIAVKNGAAIVGDDWPADEYDFEESIAVKDGKFVGLAIDEDNEDDRTQERIEQWVASIKPHFQ
jgi:flavodoxin I